MPRAFLVKKTAVRVAYGAKAPPVPIGRWPEELLGRGKEIRRFLEIDKDPEDTAETRDSEIRGLRDVVSQVIENGNPPPPTPPPPLPSDRWRFASTGSGATEVERDSVQEDPASERDGSPAAEPRDPPPPPPLENRSKATIKRVLIGFDEDRLAPDSPGILLAPLPLSVIQPVRGLSSSPPATSRYQALLSECPSRSFRCRLAFDCFCPGSPSLRCRPLATDNDDYGRMESHRKKSPDVVLFPTVSCTSLGVSGASFAKAPPIEDDDDAYIVQRYHFSKSSTNSVGCSSLHPSSIQKPLEFPVNPRPQDAVGPTEVTCRARRPEAAARFQCEACRKSYSTSGGLSRHRESHCSVGVERTFACPHCDGKSYTSLGALKMHIRTHTLPCRCRVCGKAFSRPWLLQGHLRTHTGEKPFECPHCRRAFADRSNLRAHLQTHTVAKRYRCRACVKTFSRMSLLLKHKENSCCF